MKQYSLNVQLDISLRDLQNTKQKYNESFAEYLTRWREKLGQMRHRPAETDQLIIAMEGCVPALSKKLGDLRIRNFEELYRFEVEKEYDLAQENKFFSGRTANRMRLAQATMYRSMPSGHRAAIFSLILSVNPTAAISSILSTNRATARALTLLGNRQGSSLTWGGLSPRSWRN